MKYFIIETVGGHGGMNYYVNGLAMGLSGESVDVYLFTCDETREVSHGRVHISKPFIKIYGHGARLRRGLRYVRGLIVSARAIRKLGGRVCHLHVFQYGLMELTTFLILRCFGISLMVTVHDVESLEREGRGRLFRAILRLPMAFIVHNLFSANALKDAFSEVSVARQIIVIPHGNYLPFIHPLQKNVARKKLEISDDKKVILFFGQIKKVKGLDLLIRAMALVIKDIPEATLVIAGKPWRERFDQYDTIINRLGLEGNVVKRIGYVPDSLVGAYYSASNVVVLPYRRIYQSGVLLMSMSYGCVTVCSDLPAMREVVKDGVNGYCFRTGDAADLARVIGKVLTVTGASVSTSGTDTMREMHDWNAIARRHLELYEELCTYDM